MILDRVAGQERCVGVLKLAIAGDRLPQAWIFSGREGVGKSLAARCFAAALLCPQAPRSGCDRCSVCRRVLSGVHPDALVVSPDGAQLTIDQVREVNRALHLKPFEGARRIAILVDVERANQNAQNALLKTLEEPPGASLVILCTASTSALLPTVRSRCREVRFGPLPDDLLRERAAAALGTSPTDARVSAAVALADGSLGRTLALAAESSAATAAAFCERALEPGRKRASDLIDLAEGLRGDRELAARAASLCAVRCAAALRASAGSGDRARIEASVRSLAAALAAQRDLARNGNVQLVTERLLFALASNAAAGETATGP